MSKKILNETIAQLEENNNELKTKNKDLLQNNIDLININNEVVDKLKEYNNDLYIEYSNKLNDLNKDIDKRYDFIYKDFLRDEIHNIKIKRRIAIESKRINIANYLLYVIKYLEKLL